VSASANLDERHSRFELRTLLETSRLLIESQDPDFVLNNLLLITMGKLLVTKGMILIFKPGENVYYASRSKGRGWLEENGEVKLNISAKDQDTSVLFGEQYQELFSEMGIEKESVLFNLKTSNHHIGFLCLGPKGNKKELVASEIEFIESLTIISSVAIANSRMFKEMRHINRRLDRKVHDLNTLLELSKDFNLMVDRDEIARVFKFAMLGQMLIRTFFFALDDDGEKSIVSISGIKEEPTKEELDKLFAMDDVTHISERSDCEFLNENNIKLVIGLKFQNEKIGVVGVGLRGNKQEYGAEEVNFLQSLGNLALLTIQKTQLLDERIQMQRMEEELSLAKNIQIGLLPDPLPTIDRFDLSAINISSRQVGGDYFDFIETPQKNHLLAIADVTGKGVPASLLMANLQSMLHALAPIDVTMSEATGSINDIIHKNTPADKFITFFWGMIMDEGTRFKYVNAGHNPPMMYRKASDEVILLEEGGVILGAMPTLMPYESSEIDLEPGDLIVFFTDGVTEAMNPDQTEEYEEDRLMECIKKNRHKSSKEIQDAIIDDINAFSNNIQYDDITIIVLKVAE
jgi:sigma-B regulation protein RsbU (phosphoserine phosphatase)